MSNIPVVSVSFSNNNLVKQVAVIDGQAALVGSAAQAGNYGKVYVINSLADAEEQGITDILESEAHRQVTEFYQELAGTQELFLLLIDPAITMASMLDSTNANYANKLIQAGAGKIAYLGVFKTAIATGADFIDGDVPPAVTAAKTFVQAWNAKGYFFRVLIGGYIKDETSVTIYQPKTADNGFAGVVLLSTKDDKTSSVGLVLGRKVKYSCHIKLGKTANGPLSAASLYIGTKLVETLPNLDSLAGDGYIIALTRPGKAGYYFGIDNMASTDDYRLLVYGAVIDAAARVSFAYYMDWLESECDVDANGHLLDEDAQHLSDNISAQITANLGDRISNVQVNIDRGQVIVPGNVLNVQLRIIPKGYYTFINVDLGLTA